MSLKDQPATDPPQDELLAATAAHLNWPWGLDRANALIVRLRDRIVSDAKAMQVAGDMAVEGIAALRARIVEQAERDNKQCALLQAYARNDCEQDETIAALRAQLAGRQDYHMLARAKELLTSIIYRTNGASGAVEKAIHTEACKFIHDLDALHTLPAHPPNAEGPSGEAIKESLKSARWLLTGNTTQHELRQQIVRMADLIERLQAQLAEAKDQQ